jgi:hypothetical protein
MNAIASTAASTTSQPARAGEVLGAVAIVEPSRRLSQPPPPSSTGRWWFAFDRWLVVADQEEEFVLA